ncbi:hypothetical protein K435DRAFT_860802 [Dendrothele bispora CBS 962.96]|uniref:Uncharacterized protein n=1 Tax=Dendrothele bispora (strain CBS 962.96) TaxID=1314807 RepID=A0A4S8LY79_DENBC|nr:hypothetical protein K435DRAFT_860802 [Dendrothele bispora CBS 962.96]
MAFRVYADPHYTTALRTSLVALPEKFQSKITTPPSFPWTRIMDYLDITGILALRRLNRETKHQADRYMDQVFTYERPLKQYFSLEETRLFRYIHEATGVLASGIPALSFLSRRPIDRTVLKLFVVNRHAGTLISFLQQIGFVCVRYTWRQCTANYKPLLNAVQRSTFLDTIDLKEAYPDLSVEARIHFAREDSGIDVYVCPRSPVQAILQGACTCDTVFFTASEAYCLFPQTLLSKGTNYILRVSSKSQRWFGNALGAYDVEEWPRFDYVHPLVTTSSDFQPFPRFLGDNSCYILRFSGGMRNLDEGWSGFHANQFAIIHSTTPEGCVLSLSSVATLSQCMSFYTTPNHLLEPAHQADSL